MTLVAMIYNWGGRLGQVGDKFNSEGELQKPELLNDIWDLASLCVVRLLRLDRIGTGVDSIDRKIALRVVL